MSTAAPPLRLTRTPALPAKSNADTKYWGSFKSPLLVKENNAITHIDFCPVSPHDFAVTSSTRVQIFSAKTRQVVKTIARFKDTVYSGSFRCDGKLLVAGDAKGLIQVFDSSSRAILVTLQPTQLPTQVTKFHPTDKSVLLSASDDKVVRLWDLTSPKPLASFNDHTDYVRTASFVAPNVIATGCYDGIVRIYDSRADTRHSGPVSVLSGVEPVECVHSLNTHTLASAAGSKVTIWDLAANRRVGELSNFQKTVTSVSSVAGQGDNTTSLIASSLDGHVKIFNRVSSGWKAAFGWKFGGAVLAAGVSPDNKHFVAGLTSGLISVRTRKVEKVVQPEPSPVDSPENTFSMLRSGAQYSGSVVVVDDRKTSSAAKRHLAPHEKHINKFRWPEALDVAFDKKTDSETTLTILEELKRRGKVSASLSGRDEASLEPILRWGIQSIKDSKYVPAVADWIGCCVDLYGGVIDKSPLLSELVLEFTDNLQAQILVAKDAQRIQGMLGLLMT